MLCLKEAKRAVRLYRGIEFKDTWAWLEGSWMAQRQAMELFRTPRED